MKRNKKKGFTLVELIAVIAILAILAAVIVPKIGSYTNSARQSRLRANATTVLNAIEIYNAQSADSKKITVDTGSSSMAGDPLINTLKGLSVDASTNSDTTKLDANVGKTLKDTLDRLDTTNDAQILSANYSGLQALAQAATQ